MEAYYNCQNYNVRSWFGRLITGTNGMAGDGGDSLSRELFIRFGKFVGSEGSLAEMS